MRQKLNASGLERPLFAAAGAALVLLGLIVYFASAMEGRLRRTSSSFRTEHVAALRRMADLQLELFDLKGATANHLLAGDAARKEAIQQQKRELETAIERLRVSVDSPGERAVVEEISGLFEQCASVSGRAIAANEAGRADEARSLVTKDLWELTRKLRAACDTGLALNDKLLDEATRSDLRAAAGLRWATWGAALAIGLGAAAAGWWVARLAARQHQDQHLVDVERMMSSFLAHEVRNPLAVMNMRLHSLQREASSDSAREDVAVMQGVVTRLDRTVATFLEFAGTAAPTPANSDVRGLIDHAVRGVRPFLDAARVQVEVVVDEPGLTARVDARQVGMVLQNLLMNSAQAMPQGGVVQLLARVAGPTGERPARLEIVVKDTGSGIPDHVRERLFQPFVSGRSDGIGLGLTLSHRLARLNGGKLELQTSGSEGTSFRVSIPRA
jgi:signal transduction histidine kinase